jgi:Lrp/AsnC family transcriptional regulator for asnA, asnC and gidA
MLDETNQKMICLLEEDARRSNRDIARRIGVSESTVRTRLRKLHEDGTIRFRAVTDPLSEGLNARAFVRLVVTMDQLKNVTQTLVNRNETAFVASTSGRYNLVTFVLTQDDSVLRKLVSDEIAALEGVIDIDVRPVIEGLKYDAHLVRVLPS